MPPVVNNVNRVDPTTATARRGGLGLNVLSLLPPARYAVAVVCVIFGALARAAFGPVLDGAAVPFITFYPAVMISSWVGGLGPGVLTTALSALVANYFWISPRFEFVSDASGAAALVLFVGMGFSISLLSEWSRRAQRRAQQLQEELRITLASIGDAVIATDSNGCVVLMNRVAETLTGWKVADALGKSLPEVCCVVNEDTREPIDNPALRAVREGQTIDLGDRPLLISRDGSARAIEDAGSPIRDAAGQIVGAVLIFRDVTERRRIAAAESQALYAAEEANRSKDQFFAMLSHELRNPLSSILGWAVVLRTKQLPPEKMAHALEVIERNARAEAAMVDSLFDIARITSGKLSLAKDRIELYPVVGNVVESLRPMAEEKRITIDLESDGPSPAVLGDSNRLQQVFSNLLNNALKFTPPGGHVHVRLMHQDSKVQAHFVDNGEGIDPAFLPHIFERFKQGESGKNRSHDGLGLGLCIVRELVNLHGGNILAASAGKGRGSTFTVTLPTAPTIVELHDGNGIEEKVLAGMRILVVDDNADTRDLLCLILESQGAKVAVAGSTAEAMQFFGRDTTDLVIADIGMPQEDGYVLIQRFRGFEHQNGSKRTPAIALTAYASASDRDEVLAGGFDAHLSKPILPFDLLKTISSLRQKNGQEG